MMVFPKIFVIGTDYILDIFKEPVEITEKIDGSQFNFGRVKGTLHMRSKGCVQYAETPDKMFAPAVDYVVSIQERIPDDTVFHCEYLRKPHHNTLCYQRTPKNGLILFGVSASSTQIFDEQYYNWAEQLDIETVPVLYRGMINNAAELLGFLETDSILGGTKIEGVVVKNYQRKWLIGGQPMPIMCGKFVSEKFKEQHTKTWSSGQNKIDVFLESFHSEARWLKAVQHLRDNSQLENSPRDIGKLLKEIMRDLHDEEAERIKKVLYGEYIQRINRHATHGFPEWYKEQLLKNSFVKEV